MFSARSISLITLELSSFVGIVTEIFVEFFRGEGILTLETIVSREVCSMAISGSSLGPVSIKTLAWLGTLFGVFSLTNPVIDVAITLARLACSCSGCS